MGDKKYSEIEIQTAKNLIAVGYKWIARDKNGLLYAYDGKPEKLENCWRSDEWQEIAHFVPIFTQIRWEDEEPVRLRDIVPQILTDEEREWLRTVVKPFRDRLKEVEVYDGVFYGRYVMFATIHPEKWGDSIGEDMEHTLLPVPEDWFKGIRNHNKYTPEELGI